MASSDTIVVSTRSIFSKGIPKNTTDIKHRAKNILCSTSDVVDPTNRVIRIAIFSIGETFMVYVYHEIENKKSSFNESIETTKMCII